MADQSPATINDLKHTLGISWVVCAQLSCLYSRHSDVEPCKSHFVIANILSGVYRLHLPLLFFLLQDKSVLPMTVSSLNQNINSQQTCHHFLSGDSSVHSSHSFLYSKTFPPHLSSLSLVNKHASGHWSALVRPTKLHLCKPNELLPLQLPCVSKRVGFSIPCLFSQGRRRERMNTCKFNFPLVP